MTNYKSLEGNRLNLKFRENLPIIKVKGRNWLKWKLMGEIAHSSQVREKSTNTSFWNNNNNILIKKIYKLLNSNSTWPPLRLERQKRLFNKHNHPINAYLFNMFMNFFPDKNVSKMRLCLFHKKIWQTKTNWHILNVTRNQSKNQEAKLKELMGKYSEGQKP